MNKLIGILAGMGPRSTAPFLEAVIDECQVQYGARYDEDFPPMMIYSLPTPFYLARPIIHERMLHVITEGLQKLESTGVSFIAMPCNSAHIYFEQLEAAIQIPLLNIVEETVQTLPANASRVTLLATPATIKSGIYQAGIEQAGYELVLQDEWQHQLNRLIQSVKSGTRQEKLINEWHSLLEKITGEKIEAIILACTDLNVVTGNVNLEMIIIDSSRCLAKAVVREYLQ